MNSLTNWVVSDVEFLDMPATYDNLLRLTYYGCSIQVIDAFALWEHPEVNDFSLVIWSCPNVLEKPRKQLPQPETIRRLQFCGKALAAVVGQMPNTQIVMLVRQCDSIPLAAPGSRRTILSRLKPLPFDWRPLACNYRPENTERWQLYGH